MLLVCALLNFSNRKYKNEGRHTTTSLLFSHLRRILVFVVVVNLHSVKVGIRLIQNHYNKP